MKPLYVSATKQDSGKTTTTLALVEVMRHLSRHAGYMKPVGQRYVSYEGRDIDEDVVLLHHAFGLSDRAIDMNPVAIRRGFTSEYILNRDPKPLETRIVDGFARLRDRHELVVVEGTGHAGVGSCLDLSNARVAELLGADVLIVTDGGIGRAIDEVALNLALFAAHGVRVLGVVLNKVWPEKLARVESIVAKGLKHVGTELLGVIPYHPELACPRMDQIVQKLHAEVLCGRNALTNCVENTVVAAMTAQDASPYIAAGSLVVTPGDRVDMIQLALDPAQGRPDGSAPVAGLVLTGGFDISARIAELAKASGIPVLMCKEDTYAIAARLRDSRFKILPDDLTKIKAAKNLIHESLDVESLLTSLTDSP